MVAVDRNGLRSEASLPMAVSAVPEAVTEVLLGRAYPNPFNPQTTIEYALPSAQNARLAVYDLSGRLVRILVDGPEAAGRHAVVWARARPAGGCGGLRGLLQPSGGGGQGADGAPVAAEVAAGMAELVYLAT